MSSSRSDHSKDQEYVFKLIKHIQYAMLTTADDDGNLCSRPMTYKQGDSDLKTELWLVKWVFLLSKNLHII
ncbi:unnamed protein product [Rotaria sp. Silwood1]|nr:unnamed protein product [Rotaria sp. Silwood1]